METQTLHASLSDSIYFACTILNKVTGTREPEFQVITSFHILYVPRYFVNNELIMDSDPNEDVHKRPGEFNMFGIRIGHILHKRIFGGIAYFKFEVCRYYYFWKVAGEWYSILLFWKGSWCSQLFWHFSMTKLSIEAERRF